MSFPKAAMTMQRELFEHAVEDSDTQLHAYKRHISVKPAIAKRRSHLSNIWIFDSPKNNRRFVIEGDVAFMHVVLMEGDLSIASYDPDPVPVYASIDGEVRQTKLDAVVRFTDGHIEWREFKRDIDSGANRTGRARPQLNAQAQAAAEAGVKYRVLTDRHLDGKQILFDNWLLLSAAITRARQQPLFLEIRLLNNLLDMHESITVGALMETPESDPGLMLAVIAKSLQKGLVYSELHNQLFGAESVLSRSAA